MSNVFVLQSVEAEGPGRIVTVFRDFGIPIEVRRLYRGEEVPSDLDEIRAMVVLGGPMGVADIGKEQNPFLAAEMEILKRMISRDPAMLGIFLGGQLLAHAAGGQGFSNIKMIPGP